MPNRRSLIKSSAISPDFVRLAVSWVSDPEAQFVRYVWAGYDSFKANPPEVNRRDLERSISQLLEPRIRQAMTGYEPYYIQHGSFERETMLAPPAQPPEYDLAFVLRAEERIMWPLEAKVLETSGQTANYIKDINNEYLTCRYAPFTASGAMLGFLLSGDTNDVFSKLSNKLGCSLNLLNEFPNKANRHSDHVRVVPLGKSYPSSFRCYHLLLDFPELQRDSS